MKSWTVKYTMYKCLTYDIIIIIILLACNMKDTLMNLKN